MKKKINIVKITLVLLLVFGISTLSIINSFWGNPISAAIAKTKIKEYVQMNYADINTQIEPVFYNFKDGGYYHATVQATDSVDTVFNVNIYKTGRIEDSYHNVVNLSTTLERLNNELDAKVENIIAEQFPYETRLVGCGFIDVQDKLIEKCLIRDMHLDMEKPPLPVQLHVWCSAEQPNYNVLATRMLELRDIMDSNKIPVEYYSVSVEYPYIMEDNSLHPIQWDSFSVHDFPAQRLNESNLPVVLEDYLVKWEKEHEK